MPIQALTTRYYRPNLGFVDPVSSAATTAATGAVSVATLGIGAALALAGQGIQAWIASARLRGGQKIASTNVANFVEAKLKDLKATYEASSKTPANYAYAKQLQTQLLDFLQSSDGCGNMQLGSAGQRCINERLCESGCPYPWLTWYSLGEPPSGSVNAIDAATGSVVATGQSPTLGQSSSPLTSFAGDFSVSTLLLVGGALIAAYFLMEKS